MAPQSIHSAETRHISEHDAQPLPAPRSNPQASGEPFFLKSILCRHVALGMKETRRHQLTPAMPVATP
jgi:hypothetical protein